MHLRNILLVVGVLASVMGVTLAVLWFTQRPSTEATVASVESAGPAQPAVIPNGKTILIAAHPIRSGTLLRPEDLASKTVPGSEVTPDNIAGEAGAESKLTGSLAQRDFAAGEPLLSSALLKPTDRDFLVALLSPGTRAVTIAVEAPQSSSGLLLPDNRVDIILTQTFEQDADPTRKSVGETVLRNLRVIAVDQRLGVYEPPVANAANSDASSPVPKTITLEVTERQAEMLMVASRLGRVEVAVRALGPEDAEAAAANEVVSSVWASDVSPALKTLKRAPASPAVAAPTAAPAQRPRQPIEVMHGPKIEAR